MLCTSSQKSGRISAILRFKRDQLIYDIENICHIEGTAAVELSPHVRHMIQDVAQDGNIDRISRVLETAVATAREWLYSHTGRAIDHSELDNELRHCPIFGIALDLPADFSQTTLVVLQRQIHEFLVCTAVNEWLDIIAPDRKEKWLLKALNAKEAILHTLHRRRTKTRRRSHPF